MLYFYVRFRCGLSFLGKFMYNLLLVISVELLTFPFILLFFNLPMGMIQILVSALLALVGFVAIGLLVSLFSLKSQGRELLANVVSLPLFLPALFIGLSMTVDIAKGMSLPDVWRQDLFLLLYDVFFLAAAYLGFDSNYMD